MMTAQRIAAIPTKYKGVQFRSRLEARWAAWMDMVGFKWVYEPLDFNGYIPDFALTDLPGCPVLEIKPFESLALHDLEEHVYPAMLKAREAMPDRTVIVFGSRIFGADELTQSYWHYPYESDPPAILGVYQVPGDRLRLFRVPCLEMLRELWNEASSAVQWKGQN